MYRTTKIFAWWPKRVWKRLCDDPGLCSEGEWRSIWLRSYYIVEKLRYKDVMMGNLWQYAGGNYYDRIDANRITMEKNS